MIIVLVYACLSANHTRHVLLNLAGCGTEDDVLKSSQNIYKVDKKELAVALVSRKKDRRGIKLTKSRPWDLCVL